MSNKKTAKHPKKKVEITFTETDHKYMDSLGFTYKSGTAFVGDLFPKFDAKTIAEKMAAKGGDSAKDLQAKWQASGLAACKFGTRCHEMAEAVFNSLPAPHAPDSEEERKAFNAMQSKASEIKAATKVCGAEIIIFDPDLYISGTVDLLCKNAKGEYIILDWKTNKALSDNNKYGSTALSPFGYIHDCHIERYSFQLSLYEFILRRNNYLPAGAIVKRGLLWYNRATGKVEPVQVTDRGAEVREAIINNLIPPF
ncbi:MAG: PD-(D/E)XK nuclease family protein [Bacteroidales bacterium]|nr:PD-(D/E)XK nuclease family protein [Bacteroidales bacterium]